MSEIARRVWREPAVALGLAASVALAVITIATGDPWDAAAIAGVAAPLVSALGIREFVTPTAHVNEVVDQLTAPPPPLPPEPPDST